MGYKGKIHCQCSESRVFGDDNDLMMKDAIYLGFIETHIQENKKNSSYK